MNKQGHLSCQRVKSRSRILGGLALIDSANTTEAGNDEVWTGGGTSWLIYARLVTPLRTWSAREIDDLIQWGGKGIDVLGGSLVIEPII